VADIAPFRGVRYNRERFDTLDVTAAQPYDKITDELREKYYAASQYNIARIIKGRTSDSDTPTDNQYTRARDYYREWLESGILVRDKKPCLYAYNQTFTTPDQVAHTRRGCIAALRLTDFVEGVVLPHERTLSGPKVDRLNLTRACGAHFGQIFILYPDPGGRVASEVARHAIGEPAISVKDGYGFHHAVWPIGDPDGVGAIVQGMADKTLFIADGHHRYETALGYRDEMRAARPTDGPNAAYGYCMVTLISMSDPGLLILPTHRLMHSITSVDAGGLIERAREFFDISAAPDPGTMLAQMARAGGSRPVFGLYDGEGFHLLALRDASVMDRLAEPGRAPEWKMLDVTILHTLLIEHILGLSKESVARQENIRYIREATECVDAIRQGSAQFAFFMNPTRIEQVRAIAEKGERMPQKSTDFYPKLLSGLVILPAGSGEVIP
jgi:uncharacterized protein (DUF1015 family)